MAPALYCQVGDLGHRTRDSMHRMSCKTTFTAVRDQGVHVDRRLACLGEDLESVGPGLQTAERITDADCCVTQALPLCFPRCRKIRQSI